MKLVIKHFDQMTGREVFEIMKLRVSVFVVEQNCPYQEVDDKDPGALHLWLEDEEGIQAYLRLLDRGASFPEVALGRVIAVKRRQGLGTRIVEEGIRAAREYFRADAITIEAQTYARKLYENLGFRQISEEFLEDGIPHIRMQLIL